MFERRILDLVKKEAPLNPLAYVHDIVRDLAADNLKEVMLACRECNDDDFRTTFNGDVRADIMIINDRPRSDHSIFSMAETEELEMLNKVFTCLEYNTDKLFYIDAINCFTYKKVGDDFIMRTPSKSEVECCKVFVDHAIDIVKPKAILLLGPIASGMYQLKAFSEIRGEWLQVKGVPAIATYHPEKLIDRDGRYNPEDLADMKEEFINSIETVIESIK